MDVNVRRGRPGDLNEVSGFATETWDGWDYVPDVWEDWLEEGLTVVAETKKVVGVLHATRRGGEAWLEGLRVAEETRREGIATTLIDEALSHLNEEGAKVARCMAFDDNQPAVELLDSVGFERVTTVRHARGFGFPYGTQIKEANYDDSLKALRETDAFNSVQGLYATTDWRMWEAPETVEEYNGDVVGFVEDGDVRAVALCDGVRANTAGEERRSELVFGLLWCEPAYA